MGAGLDKFRRGIEAANGTVRVLKSFESPLDPSENDDDKPNRVYRVHVYEGDGRLDAKCLVEEFYDGSYEVYVAAGLKIDTMGTAYHQDAKD